MLGNYILPMGQYGEATSTERRMLKEGFALARCILSHVELLVILGARASQAMPRALPHPNSDQLRVIPVNAGDPTELSQKVLESERRLERAREDASAPSSKKVQPRTTALHAAAHRCARTPAPRGTMTDRAPLRSWRRCWRTRPSTNR